MSKGIVLTNVRNSYRFGGLAVSAVSDLAARPPCFCNAQHRHCTAMGWLGNALAVVS
jgi:hypothetical protein